MRLEVIISSPHRQRQLSRLAITITLILFAAVLARQLLSKPNLYHKNPRARSHHALIQGRWKAVRASLGLPPLPDTITINPSVATQTPTPPPPPTPESPPLRTEKFSSRFDLRRKRDEAELPSQSRLHLAADARDAPRVSLEALAASFRHIAAAEREMAEIRGKRERLGQKARVQRRVVDDWLVDPINAKDVFPMVTND